MVDPFRVVPAAYVIFRRADPHDEVLLQLRQNTGYMDGFWATGAAGHVEAGESVFAAAVREAREELGVGIDAGSLQALCTLHRTQANHAPIDERVDFFFECQQWSGVPAVMEPSKAADLRWFSLDALPDPVVPHERYVLERLRDGGLDPVVAFGFS